MHTAVYTTRIRMRTRVYVYPRTRVYMYTVCVDEHVNRCVWDVYMSVYMARYGHTCTRSTAVTCRLGPCTRPCRPNCHVHDCVLAVYTDVYMARTRPFNCGVNVCTCRTAVQWPSYMAVYTAVNGL